MASGDRYLLTVRGHHGVSGTQIQNAFVYLQQEGTGTAARLNSSFADDVIPVMLPPCSDGYIIDDLYTINLDDAADYNTQVIGLTGAIAGDVLPLFVTYAFEYVRTTRAIQNGRKAIGLVPESMIVGGDATPAAIILLNNMALAFIAELDDAITVSSWRPQLWRRPGTYESGVVTAPGLFYDVDTVRFTRVSSQNTRKIGRGA